MMTYGYVMYLKKAFEQTMGKPCSGAPKHLSAKFRGGVHITSDVFAASEKHFKVQSLSESLVHPKVPCHFP